MRGSRRSPSGRARRATARFAVTVLVAGVAMQVVTTPARAASTISISYTMAERFGSDRNGDGLPNDPHNSSSSAQPSSFTVTLDACASTRSTSYRWTIGSLPPFSTVSCRTTQQLTSGLKLVRLKLADGTEGGTVIWVRDIVVVSMGDSLSSGEGNPDRAAQGGVGPAWQSRRCHRSSKAGSARAARILEAGDPRSSVTFVHVACSGAGLRQGILESYAGIEPPARGSALDPQLKQVRDILGSRRVDVLLLSAGANDAGFGPVVLKCIVQQRCHRPSAAAALDPAWVVAANAICALPFLAGFPVMAAACAVFVNTLLAGEVGPSAKTFFDQNIELIRGTGTPLDINRYRQVATAFAALPSAGGLGLAPSRVFLMEYFDPSRDQSGRICDPANFGSDVTRTIPGGSGEEMVWVRDEVVPRLNGAGAAAATAYGWTRVGGIAAAFGKAGYCADDANRLVRRMDESLGLQHNEQGTMHPNFKGHGVYANRIADAMFAYLSITPTT